MRLPLLLTLSFVVAGFSSCADHKGSNSGSIDASAPVGSTTKKPDILTGSKPEEGFPSEPGQGGGTPPGGGDGTDGIPGGAGPVPEPSTLLLVGTGLAGVAMLRRRRRPVDAS